MASPEILSQLAVREAIDLLREYGVTPEQYATWDTAGSWIVDGINYSDREAAFAAAQSRATEWGDQVEVWRKWADGEAAESWIVKP